LASGLRKRGVKAPYPGAAFANAVLLKCQGKSVLSGESNVKRLCIVQVDPDAGWIVDNALLVTSAESYALCRASRQCREMLLSRATMK